MHAKQLGESLQEIVALAENMQFRVRDVGDIVRTATEDLDNMICCFGDPDKHEKVEKYREVVQIDIGRLHKIFEGAPSSISAHEYYPHARSLVSEMRSLVVAVQSERPLFKASLVDDVRHDEKERASPRANASPRAEDGKAGAVRKPLRVVMDPKKSAAAERSRADS